MMISGGEIVVRCLQEEKIECVFGYPVGSVLHIYDALFKQDQVRHILVRHEQAAAMLPTLTRDRRKGSVSLS